MLDVPSILGGAGFLCATTAALYGGALYGVVKEALHPERRTVGWALGRGSPADPAVWDVPSREWCHGFDGASCPVFDMGVEDPGAPTAILIHGFARSRFDSLARLGPILPRFQRVLLPDLPGHGDAIGRSTRLGADEDAFIESLVLTATTGPVVLVGHSLGATIAVHAATRDGLASRVHGILALAPYERLRTPLGARLDLRGMPRGPLLGPAIAALAALGVRERSTRAAAERVACPIAVLAGELDPVTPVEEARAIANAATTSRFAILAHGRHDDFHTSGSSEMAAALDWISSRG